MSVGSKIALLAVAAGICLAVNQWELTAAQPSDLTRAALRQFDNSDVAAVELRVADASRHWWTLGGVAGLIVLAICLFKEDAERLWKHSPEQS